MADTKITNLTALTGANTATGDLLPIVDVSASSTKKITIDELRQAAVFTGAFAARATFPCVVVVACSTETTAITPAATNVVRFRMPHAMTVTAVRASLNSACTTGTFTVDINESGTTILSTKLTFDATEKTTVTAATPAVISDSALADDAEMSVDTDNVGDGTATGLKIYLIGTRVV
jgi:hypothetical protein